MKALVTTLALASLVGCGPNAWTDPVAAPLHIALQGHCTATLTLADAVQRSQDFTIHGPGDATIEAAPGPAHLTGLFSTSEPERFIVVNQRPGVPADIILTCPEP